MQLDEEVGKLASATPVMISKSLECFIQVLLDEACKQVRAGGSHKLTANHLKQMINTNENFDFLRELVDSVPDVAAPEPKAPSKPRKPSTASADGTGAKKRGKKPAAAAVEPAGDDEMEEGDEEEDEYDAESKPDVKPSSGGGHAYPPAATASGSGSGSVGGWGEGGARGPVIGSWKKDMTGGGGTGEGGKGMFDDYEEDEDDY
ncbi:hypothetical protein IAT38_004163 [Cryptococcus sp. DSM 104549]